MAIDEDDLADLDADIVSGDAEIQNSDGKRVKKKTQREMLEARAAASASLGQARASRVSYIRIRDER